MIYERRSKQNNDNLRLCYGGWDKDLRPGQTYGPVIRDTYIVECCTAGFGSVVINGREFPVKGGDCYILLPGDTVIHTAAKKEPRTGVFCSLDGGQIGEYLARAGITSESPFAPPELFAELHALVEMLVTMKDDMDAGADLRRSGCMQSLFGILLRGCPGKDRKTDPVDKAVRLMQASYQEPLSVAQIAKEVGLERCYFSTQFRLQTGLSPHQYLTRLRIEKACLLMTHSGCSVAVAAASVGIPVENFARLFRRWKGQTPSQFRKTERNGP